MSVYDLLPNLVGFFLIIKLRNQRKSEGNRRSDAAARRNIAIDYDSVCQRLGACQTILTAWIAGGLLSI